MTAHRPATAPLPAEALGRCVGDAEAFAAQTWGRSPLLREAADGGGFADLLSLDDVDHLVTSTGLRAPAFRLVRDGETLEGSRYLRRARVGSRPIADLADVGRVMAEFEAGATIVLQGLHRYWPPLAAFCRALERVLTHPVQANAYLTPPTAAGLDVHADAHDVFALQTHGEKEWVVHWDSAEDEPRRLVMRPGDVLYLPRGTRHAARTVHEPSLHITLGVRATTWRDVAEQALAAVDDAALAEPLPVGWASQPERVAGEVAERLRDLARAVDKLEPAQVAGALSDAFHDARPPLLAGQLRDLLEVGTIDDETTLRRRHGTVCALRRRGQRVEALLGDRRLSLPAHAEPALRFVADADALRPADLAAHLDETGRLVLARRLVREGLLAIDRDGATR